MNEQKDLMHTISRNIRQIKKTKQKTISSIAETSNVSTTLITDLLNDHKRNVSINTLELLAGALECDVRFFFTPVSDDEYPELDEELFNYEEENARSNCAYRTKLQRTYYPPTAETYNISSFLELILILPLLHPLDLYENLYRILGQTNCFEEYCSKQFDYSWRQVPETSAKKYVEKELKIIREKRNGNTDFDIPFDDEYEAEYDDYKELITEKRELVKNVILLLKKQSFPALFSLEES